MRMDLDAIYTEQPANLYRSLLMDGAYDGETEEQGDGDLEFEENVFIKVEQQALLAPRRPERLLSPAPDIRLPLVNRPSIDLFIERFIDAFAPDAGNDCGTLSAIRQASSVRLFSPLLSGAFQAVSMAYFGQFTGSWTILSQGYSCYQQTLNYLQGALFDPKQSRSEGVLATVVLLMAYESLQYTSEKALVNHCIGALKLIEFRNPWNHMFGVAHSCFIELLPYWVATALVLRKPTFLARPEWKTVPWSARGGLKDIMEHLLEHVVDLPAILWRHDQYIIILRSGSKPTEEINTQYMKLWASITTLEGHLRRWKCEWADTYPTGQPYEADCQGTDYFPVFRYTDPITLNIITPPIIVYPDLQLARTLCTYYAAMLQLISVDKRPHRMRLEPERLEYAHLICRSIEYYIRAVPGNLINRIVFPLRVAYDSLPHESLERRFVEQVFQLVERKNSLKSWGKFIPDISMVSKT